jgi:hypothetical protein
MVTIKVFRADSNLEDCGHYIEGHRKVLEAYGVTQVTSANLDWTKEPFSYLILVQSNETGRALGGGRIQLAGGSVPLPLETAIDTLDPRIHDLVHQRIPARTAEYCGLWNSREIAGYGIGSIFLMRAGVAIIEQLRLGSFFAFASQATCQNSLHLGFKVIRSLGINGIFYYPKEDLIATALLIEDPKELKGATDENRKRIFDLRRNPVQTTIERGPRGEIEVNYDLRISQDELIGTTSRLSR